MFTEVVSIALGDFSLTLEMTVGKTSPILLNQTDGITDLYRLQSSKSILAQYSVAQKHHAVAGLRGLGVC